VNGIPKETWKPWPKELLLTAAGHREMLEARQDQQRKYARESKDKQTKVDKLIEECRHTYTNSIDMGREFVLRDYMTRILELTSKGTEEGCKHTNITGGETFYKGDALWSGMRCLDCGHTWDEECPTLGWGN